jgi:hypothetical protein
MSFFRISIKGSVQGGSQALDHGVLINQAELSLWKALQLRVLLRQALERLALFLFLLLVNVIDFYIYVPLFLADISV